MLSLKRLCKRDVKTPAPTPSVVESRVMTPADIQRESAHNAAYAVLDRLKREAQLNEEILKCLSIKGDHHISRNADTVITMRCSASLANSGLNGDILAILNPVAVYLKGSNWTLTSAKISLYIDSDPFNFYQYSAVELGVTVSP